MCLLAVLEGKHGADSIDNRDWNLRAFAGKINKFPFPQIYNRNYTINTH